MGLFKPTLEQMTRDMTVSQLSVFLREGEIYEKSYERVRTRVGGRDDVDDYEMIEHRDHNISLTGRNESELKEIITKKLKEERAQLAKENSSRKAQEESEERESHRVERADTWLENLYKN